MCAVGEPAVGGGAPSRKLWFTEVYIQGFESNWELSNKSQLLESLWLSESSKFCLVLMALLALFIEKGPFQVFIVSFTINGFAVFSGVVAAKKRISVPIVRVTQYRKGLYPLRIYFASCAPSLIHSYFPAAFFSATYSDTARHCLVSLVVEVRVQNAYKGYNVRARVWKKFLSVVSFSGQASKMQRTGRHCNQDRRWQL